MPVSPVGRLNARIDKWVSTGSNAHIVDVIRLGYKIPFKITPDTVFLKNNRSSLDNPMFVTNELGVLVKKGCISETENLQRLVIL